MCGDLKSVPTILAGIVSQSLPGHAKILGGAGDVTVACICKNEVTSKIAKNFVLIIIFR